MIMIFKTLKKEAMEMNTIQRIALALIIIGAINWGLIGLFQFDLVASLFGGQDSGIARVVYTLVGISALICLPLLFATDDEDVTDTNHGKNLTYSTEFSEDDDLSDLNNDKEK